MADLTLRVTESGAAEAASGATDVADALKRVSDLAKETNKSFDALAQSSDATTAGQRVLAFQMEQVRVTYQDVLETLSNLGRVLPAVSDLLHAVAEAMELMDRGDVATSLRNVAESADLAARAGDALSTLGDGSERATTRIRATADAVRVLNDTVEKVRVAPMIDEEDTAEFRQKLREQARAAMDSVNQIADAMRPGEAYKALTVWKEGIVSTNDELLNEYEKLVKLSLAIGGKWEDLMPKGYWDPKQDTSAGRGEHARIWKEHAARSEASRQEYIARQEAKKAEQEAARAAEAAAERLKETMSLTVDMSTALLDQALHQKQVSKAMEDSKLAGDSLYTTLKKVLSIQGQGVDSGLTFWEAPPKQVMEDWDEAGEVLNSVYQQFVAMGDVTGELLEGVESTQYTAEVAVDSALKVRDAFRDLSATSKAGGEEIPAAFDGVARSMVEHLGSSGDKMRETAAQMMEYRLSAVELAKELRKLYKLSDTFNTENPKDASIDAQNARLREVANQLEELVTQSRTLAPAIKDSAHTAVSEAYKAAGAWAQLQESIQGGTDAEVEAYNKIAYYLAQHAADLKGVENAYTHLFNTATNDYQILGKVLQGLRKDIRDLEGEFGGDVSARESGDYSAYQMGVQEPGWERRAHMMELAEQAKLASRNISQVARAYDDVAKSLEAVRAYSAGGDVAPFMADPATLLAVKDAYDLVSESVKTYQRASDKAEQSTKEFQEQEQATGEEVEKTKGRLRQAMEAALKFAAAHYVGGVILKNFRTILTTVGGALGFLARNMDIITPAIGALRAAFRLVGNERMEGLRESIAGLVHKMGNLGRATRAFITTFASASGITDALKEIPKTLLGGIGNALGSLMNQFNAVKTRIAGVGDALRAAFAEGAIRWLIGFGYGLLQLQLVADRVASGIQAVGQVFTNLASAVVGRPLRSISEQFKAVKSNIEGAVNRIRERILGSARTMGHYKDRLQGMGRGLHELAKALTIIPRDILKFTGSVIKAIGPLKLLFGTMAIGVATFGAWQISQGLLELGKAGAALQPITRAFALLAEGASTTGDALLGDLRIATKGTIADADLMRSSVVALNAEAVKSGEQFVELASLARVLGTTVGVDATTAIDNATRAIATQNPILFKSLGVLVSLDTATRQYATSVGKSVSDLTEAERKEAFRIFSVERMREAVDRVTDSNLKESETLQRLRADLARLLPGTAAHEQQLRVIAVQTAALAGGTATLNDSLQKYAALQKNLRNAVTATVAENEQFQKLMEELVALFEKTQTVEAFSAAVNFAANAVSWMLRSLLLLPRSLIAISEKFSSATTAVRDFFNPLRVLKRNVEENIQAWRSFSQEINNVDPSVAMAKATELGGQLRILRQHLIDLREQGNKFGWTRQMAAEFKLLTQQAWELTAAVKVLQERGTMMEGITFNPNAPTFDFLEGLIGLEGFESALSSAKGEVSSLSMRLWQLKEAGETTTEEFTTLTDELTTAQKKVELLEGTVARFAGGGGIDLSGIDLSSILDPMTRIVDQTKALQEEMVDARDAFATLLAQLGHVSQGTDAWKTLTEQIKSSREELERMDQRLAALNTRAASITASRAQDLARVGEGLEVALTPLLRAQFKLQFEREPPKERLLPPGMVNLPNMMDPVTARLSNMSIKAQVDSLLQAMESVRDFAGEIDPGYIDIAAQRLTSLGLSTQEANQVLARFRGTMDEFSSSANLAVSSIGSVIQGLIRGTDQLAESLTSAATQIIQTLIQIQTERRRQQIAQGITGGMSLGALGVLGTTVGAIGGIMGAVFGRRRDTQPVRIESVADSAAEALKERKEGPDTFILRVSGSDGRIEETQYVLNRRSRRDAVSRVPRGVTI